MTKQVLPPLRDKPYGGAWSIYDNESVNFLNSTKVEKGNRSDFIRDYRNWFSANKYLK